MEKVLMIALLKVGMIVDMNTMLISGVIAYLILRDIAIVISKVSRRM